MDGALEYFLHDHCSMFASDSAFVAVAVDAVAFVFSLLPPSSWLPQFFSSVLLPSSLLL